MAYERINWQNEPSEATALNDVNLNKMDSAIYEHDQTLPTKVDKVEGKGLSTNDYTDTDKTKLDNIHQYATNYIFVPANTSSGKLIGHLQRRISPTQTQNYASVYIASPDSALSSSSTNYIQNKVVKSALDNKVDKEEGKGLSQVDNVSVSSTTSAGTKIGEITVSGVGGSAVGTNLYNGVTVDSALSNESENPVQNKVVKESISDILPTNTATGNPIVINDGMKLPASECKVTMNPIQDLHGYSNPWVGGAGKNLLATPNGVDFTISDVRFYCNNGLYMSGTSSANISSTNPYFKSNFAFTLPAGTYRMTRRADAVYSMYLNKYDDDSQVAANTVTFTLSESTKVYYCIYMASGRTVSGLQENQIEAGSTSTTFAPYSNICPISGRDSVTVTRTGDNLFANATFIQGTIDGTGSPATSTTRIRSSSLLLIPKGTYKVTTSPELYGTIRVYSTNSFTSYISGESVTSWTLLNGYSFTLTSDRYVVIVLSKSNSEQITITPSDLNRISFALAETVETHTHTYASTVYGGVDDFVSGEGSVTFETVDLGTLNWTYAYASGIFYASSPTNMGERKYGGATAYSEIYKVWTGESADFLTSDAVISVNNRYISNQNRISIRDSRYTDAQTFTTAMSGVQLCYELATPTTITNTPEDISLLKGVNVLSTDGDNLSLKYSGEIQSSSGVNYSTDEQDTGIKWIDGKTIYQKTLTGVMSRGEYEYYFLCIIGTLTNAHLIKSEGVVWNDNNGYQIPINSAGTTNSMPTGDLQTFLYNRAGTLCLTLTQDSTLVGYNYAVTIYYTKG